MEAPPARTGALTRSFSWEPRCEWIFDGTGNRYRVGATKGVRDKRPAGGARRGEAYLENGSAVREPGALYVNACRAATRGAERFRFAPRRM